MGLLRETPMKKGQVKDQVKVCCVIFSVEKSDLRYQKERTIETSPVWTIKHLIET